MVRKIIKRPVNMDKSFNDTFYKRNPALMEEHTIPLTIKRFYTDVDGLILDKNDVLIPGALKTKFPIFLFAQFDRNGGYKRSLQSVAPAPGCFYYMTYTQGINSPFLSFTGFNNIKGQIQTGDIVIIYTDNLELPSCFVWFVISSESSSLASITSNVESTQQDNRTGMLYLHETNYFASVVEQFDEPLFFTAFDNIGNYRYDTLNPSLFLTPFQEQNGFITLDTEFKLDQYLGISFYYRFNTDLITLNFKVKKI